MQKFKILFPICMLSTQALLGQSDMTELILQLRGAVEGNSLVTASEIADKLDAAVQTRYRAWLVRDSNERADEVLSWIPGDMEGFWVNRRPVEMSTSPSASEVPIDYYSFDRLRRQDEGRFAGMLKGHTVRMVMAAVRGVPPPQFEAVMMPGPMTARDVIYFYFLASPLELGDPSEIADGYSLWRTEGMVVGQYVPQPRVQPTPHQDTNWVALPKPDLLILSNQRGLVLSALRRMASTLTSRALPAGLPEWQHVDRSADFWGLRHFSAESKPRPGERGCAVAELPFPDCRGVGATVRFDAAKGSIEIRYLTPATAKSMFNLNGLEITQAEAGVWKLEGDAVNRGPMQAGIGMALLGFGGYQ